MSDKILISKFLTRYVAEDAVRTAIGLTVDSEVGIKHVNGENFHIVILVPSMKEGKYPLYEIHPHLLYEVSYGEAEKSAHKFNEIARCKALQLWHDRNDNKAGSIPHLLFPGDTPYWGGVKREGIVVACSGFQSYFDKMFSGIIADLCIGLAYHSWMSSQDKKEESDFLS